MRWAAALALVGCGACAPAWAQLLGEKELPPEQKVAAPVFNAENTIALEAGSITSLRFGIEPSTISVGTDGIVRYVVVVKRPGAGMSAVFEAMRCATAQTKPLAFFNEGKWSESAADWRGLDATPYGRFLARNGACDAALPAPDAATFLRRLKAGNTNELNHTTN